MDMVRVGLDDGDALGLALGTSDGLVDGTNVGLALGLSEGDALGLVLGLALGDADGDALGLADGDALGDAEGDADGLALGLALGLTLGALLGIEGDAVGTGDVGEALGAAVFEQQHLPPSPLPSPPPSPSRQHAAVHSSPGHSARLRHAWRCSAANHVTLRTCISELPPPPPTLHSLMSARPG